MPLSLHAASVPVFRRYLEQLSSLVQIGEAHCHRCEQDPSDLLQARLADDMLPFYKQVEVAVNFSFRVCYPLAGLPIPDYVGYELSFEGLQSYISRGLALLAALDPADFDPATERVIQAEAGEGRFDIPASEYLLQYGLPNHLFHFSMAYAILRHLGAPVGKRDFDGFHVYPR